MYDYIDLGPTPAEEECEQVGGYYNPDRAQADCRRFIDVIRSAMGPEPAGARLCIRRHVHDFGPYYEVAVRFEDGNDEAVDYASRVEEEAPTRWPQSPASTEPDIYFEGI